MTGWTKVDPAAFQKGVAIMTAADPTDPEAVRDAIDQANALLGIPPKKRCKARPHDTRTLGDRHDD